MGKSRDGVLERIEDKLQLETFPMFSIEERLIRVVAAQQEKITDLEQRVEFLEPSAED